MITITKSFYLSICKSNVFLSDCPECDLKFEKVESCIDTCEGEGKDGDEESTCMETTCGEIYRDFLKCVTDADNSMNTCSFEITEGNFGDLCICNLQV